MDPEAPFYLAINHGLSPTTFGKDFPQPEGDRKWFKAQPIGPITLGGLMKKMVEKAGITGQKLTNHSVRKRGITTLLHEGVNACKIAQYSGHKNVQSINNYAVISRDQQREMSHILQRQKKSKTSALTAPSTSADHASRAVLQNQVTGPNTLELTPAMRQPLSQSFASSNCV